MLRLQYDTLTDNLIGEVLIQSGLLPRVKPDNPPSA